MNSSLITLTKETVLLCLDSHCNWSPIFIYLHYSLGYIPFAWPKWGAGGGAVGGKKQPSKQNFAHYTFTHPVILWTASGTEKVMVVCLGGIFGLDLYHPANSHLPDIAAEKAHSEALFIQAITITTSTADSQAFVLYWMAKQKNSQWRNSKLNPGFWSRLHYFDSFSINVWQIFFLFLKKKKTQNHTWFWLYKISSLNSQTQSQ